MNEIDRLYQMIVDKLDIYIWVLDVDPHHPDIIKMSRCLDDMKRVFKLMARHSFEEEMRMRETNVVIDSERDEE